jgi:NAD(P)H-dependent FMN reductase
VLIDVITGTTQQGRFSEHVTEWVLQHLSTHPEIKTELVDLRDHPLPFFDAAPPASAPRDYPSEDVARLGRTLDRADGFLLLTGEYNHGYPAVLKNAMDWTHVEWRRKPVAFVGWGNVGGARAIEQLRQIAVEFEMAPVRHAVHILPQTIMAVRQADKSTNDGAFAALQPRLAMLTEDLLWWVNALSAARRS